MDNITACLEMVKRGLGWALMPEIALDNFDGCVRPCTLKTAGSFLRRTYIFCQRDAAALPQVQLFMDMLKKSAERKIFMEPNIPHPDAGCPVQGLAHQQALLGAYGKPLVCFTMNIAGPVRVASPPPGALPGRQC